jgi:hypothetical protein
LKPVADLRQLRVLTIASYPDDSLAPLSTLQDLQYLRILHMPNVHDLGPLVDLRKLESLSLETLPSWDSSSRVTTVESLEPLATLPGLKHVALFGVVPKEKSLAALQRCPGLLSARFSKYPKTEVRRFYDATKVTDDHVPEPGAG